MPSPQASLLLCRVAGLRCALPLAHVLETMRPLPVQALAGAPASVLGLAVVRGTPIPVVDLGRLFPSSESATPGRFVTLRLGNRTLALAVEAVEGVLEADHLDTAALPSLLGPAAAAAVEAIGLHDAELLLLLRESALVPDSVWSTLET